jgi:hypothetical protein
LHFKTPQNTCAFVVAYTDPAHMRAIPQVGRYAATAWLPPNLLNDGIFHVSVVMATPDPLERYCVVERALSFNVYERLDGMDGTARGLYAREFPGAVRPRLTWETRRLPGSRVKQRGDTAAKDPSQTSEEGLVLPTG